MQPSQRDQWHDEQIVAMLYSNAAGAIFGSVSIIALVSFVLASIYPTGSLLAWFVTGQLLNLFRGYIQHLYSSDKKRFKIHTWLHIHRILTFFSGSLYGILAVFFFSSDQPLYQMLVILLSGGMGAAAVGTHSVDRLTFQLFLFSAVIPLVLRCLYEATEIHFVLSAMLCILMLIMLRSAKQTRKIMIDNINMSLSLRYRATHDGLVDLLNREEFKNEYEAMMTASEASTSSNAAVTTSMIFIDLDNFKALNDTHGHQAGDNALIRIGEIIRNTIRKSDIAARFGGDEFMILIQSDSIHQAQAVAEKILAKIQQSQSAQSSVVFGASMGIGYSKSTQIKFEDLLSTADRACYKAKNSGKGQIFTEQLTA